MMRLPQFTNDGLLPPGDYEFSFDGLRESILVVGPQSRSPDWDADWRLHLVNNLEILVRQLWQVGVSEVFADGAAFRLSLRADTPRGIVKIAGAAP